KRVQMLVAYGVRRDGRRHLLAFLRSQGESQADWEGLLQDLYRRGLEGKHLALIVTDGCAGLAAAIPTVYPRARHQRCWVHKMRNILEKVRKSDHAEVKTGAQAIYLAEGRGKAETAFRSFGARWRRQYGAVVRRLEQDLPELLSFFAFPRHLWRKLRTTNVIERCFVEVRRRTRPMVCFVNVESVDRIIYSIFQRFNLENPHPQPIYTSCLTSPPGRPHPGVRACCRLPNATTSERGGVCHAAGSSAESCPDGTVRGKPILFKNKRDRCPGEWE